LTVGIIWWILCLNNSNWNILNQGKFQI
jgi:hypothetical protein